MTRDSNTCIDDLRKIVSQFVQERDWQPYHSPKNLSMSMSIEVAELMEHFQWISEDDSRSLNESQLVEVGEEMADVFCYLLALANELNLDLSSTFARKMELNRVKYPINEFRGRYGADDPKPVKNTTTD